MTNGIGFTSTNIGRGGKTIQFNRGRTYITASLGIGNGYTVRAGRWNQAQRITAPILPMKLITSIG